MTGFMHEKEFSRKAFVKGGGALIVGFSLAGAGLAGKASAADSPYSSNPVDGSQIDSWIVINADNTASIKSGSIHQGTGATTGVLMIAAEELDLDLSQVKHVQADTARNPDTAVKAASNTITGAAGRGVRAAAAHARQALLGLAATQLGVPVSQLSVSKGVVSGGGKTVTYGQLLGGKLFNVTLPASYNLQNTGSFGAVVGLAAGAAPAKPVSQYKLIGTRPNEIDIPDVVAGTLTFIQNVRVPGMLHGRVVRPRGQAVYGFGAPVVSVDENSIRHLPGARVVRKNNFVGVVAQHEYDAIQAAAQLKLKWGNPPKALPGSGNEFEAMRALDAAGKSVWQRTDTDSEEAPDPAWAPPALTYGDVNAALASAAHVVSQSFSWPGNLHAPMGPACSVADVTPQGARIFAGTQGEYAVQAAVAPMLGLPLEKVRVTAFPMGGAFGSSPYVDSAMAAALMSQAVGAPVRVQLMRWDDIGWGNSSPATLMDVRAGIDARGKLIAFDFTQYYPQYLFSLETTGELAGATPASSFPSGQYYPARMYDLANSSYLLKSIPLEGNWIKTAWMRHGSGPHTTFAGEQVIDELAHAAGMDPVAFRLHNTTQAPAKPFLLSVVNAVTKAANWQPKVAASQLRDENVVTGRGFGWSYSENTLGAAAIADVQVNKKTGKVVVKHVYEAFSPGLVINPELVENQITGAVTQVVSRLLVEELRFDKTNVTSSDFVTYPILRFKDGPKVTPIAVSHPDMDARGVGEPPTVPVAAAVANAFFDATGVRMRTAPMTPARVRAALKAAGVA